VAIVSVVVAAAVADATAEEEDRGRRRPAVDADAGGGADARRDAPAGRDGGRAVGESQELMGLRTQQRLAIGGARQGRLQK
jgi:hypothetical protein